MYAIIRDRGRQYKVQEGDIVEIDLLGTEAASHEFNEVLLVAKDGDIKVGKPTVDGAKVTASVLGQTKGPKLDVVKFRRRKDSKTKVGHRQPYSQIKIEKIEA